jgi:hypothetical protein
MALVLDGTTGIVSANIADGTISANDLASGAITSSALPAGSVLQVVQTNYSTSVDIATGYTWIDSGLTGTITPTSTSSKILVVANMVGDFYGTPSIVLEWAERIVRDTTNVYVTSKGYQGAGVSANGYWYLNHSHSMVFLDSPSTTSAITYKVQGAAGVYDVSANAWRLRYQTTNAIVGSGTSTMTLMEIAA